MAGNAAELHVCFLWYVSQCIMMLQRPAGAQEAARWPQPQGAATQLNYMCACRQSKIQSSSKIETLEGSHSQTTFDDSKPVGANPQAWAK
jgi:hypothetical protein